MGYTSCFKVPDSVYCLAINTDDFCQANNYDSCTNKTVIGNNEKCSLNRNDNINSCEKVLKTCEDYDDETSCNNAEDCVYINNYCYSYRVDNYCEVKNGKCEAKSDADIDKASSNIEVVFPMYSW